MYRVRSISRKDSCERESSEAICQGSDLSDQDMVPSAWRHAGMSWNVIRSMSLVEQETSEIPCRVSSDPHEWRNELGAVSTTHSAKLKYL